jgi:hypothetical protein
MRSLLISAIALLLLSACGSSAPLARPTTPVTSPSSIESAQQVIDKIKATGLSVNDHLPLTQGDQALQPLYKDHQDFQVLESGKAHAGQVLLCARHDQCDNVYKITDPSAQQGLIRIWRSRDGLVVCMIDPGVSEATAKQIQTVIEALP